MKQILNGYKKLERVLFSAQKVLLLIMVVVIVGINVAQVAGRYLFHFSLPWSEQLSIVLFIGLILLGGNLAVKTDSEIKIDLRFKDPAKQRVLDVVRDVFSLVAMIIFFISSIMMVRHALTYMQIISSLKLNYAYVFMVMPVGFGLMILDKAGVLLSRFVPPEPQQEGGTQR